MEFGPHRKGPREEEKKREEKIKWQRWESSVVGPIPGLTDIYRPPKNPKPLEGESGGSETAGKTTTTDK